MNDNKVFAERRQRCGLFRALKYRTYRASSSLAAVFLGAVTGWCPLPNGALDESHSLARQHRGDRLVLPDARQGLSFFLLSLTQADTRSAAILVDELDAAFFNRFADFLARILSATEFAVA